MIGQRDRGKRGGIQPLVRLHVTWVMVMPDHLPNQCMPMAGCCQ